jgi:hypothetical protein
MSENLAIICAETIYKIGCLGVGSLFCLLGYSLFINGIWGHAGDLDAKFKSTRLVLKSAAPGTFFALLGAAIVIGTIWQGLRFDHGSAKLDVAGARPPTVPEPKQ